MEQCQKCTTMTTTTRLRLVLLFANNWSPDLIYGCFRSVAKKFPIKNFALGI
jgi:hypothetical protein